MIVAMHRKSYYWGMKTFNDTAGPLMTPRQVAALLQFTTPRPVYRMIRGGELPAARIGGRLLIDAGDVETLLAQSLPRAYGRADGAGARLRSIESGPGRRVNARGLTRRDDLHARQS